MFSYSLILPVLFASKSEGGGGKSIQIKVVPHLRKNSAVRV